MTIDGYPVVKKWLSCREFRVFGRALLQKEMTYITEVVRRLKALLFMGEPLDANHRSAATNAMGTPESKIKEAILHPEEEIRQYAVLYFSGARCDDGSIMPLVIQSVEKPLPRLSRGFR